MLKFGDNYRDMLVYNISDINGFQEWLETNTGLDKTVQAQIEQLEHYKEKAKEMGLIFDDNISITPEEHWAGRTMAIALNDYESNYNIIPKEILSDRTLFFMKYCTNANSPLFFDMSKYKPTLEHLSKAVRAIWWCYISSTPWSICRRGNTRSHRQVVSRRT